MKIKKTAQVNKNAVPYLSTARAKRDFSEPYNEGNKAHEKSETKTDEVLEQSMGNHPRFLRKPGLWANGKRAGVGK
jgi:hypothetical protein